MTFKDVLHIPSAKDLSKFSRHIRDLTVLDTALGYVRCLLGASNNSYPRVPRRARGYMGTRVPLPALLCSTSLIEKCNWKGLAMHDYIKHVLLILSLGGGGGNYPSELKLVYDRV